MKTITTELPDQKDVRRVPKPQMEKRRRDRINNSLETLRLLLLENTHNEKLRNPKVEKAEILESVVDFLKAEQERGHEPWPAIGGRRENPGGEDKEMKSPGKRHHSYHEGMRTCLRRVGHFIAAKSHELEDSREESPGATSPPHQASALPYPPVAGETDLPLTQDLSKASLRVPPLQILPYGQPGSPCSSLGRKSLPRARVCPTVSHVPSDGGPGVRSSKSPAALSDAVWRPWPL